MPMTPDGTVVSSSQVQSDFFTRGERMSPLVGVILSVKPSDSLDNLAGMTSASLRGCRHECLVLAAADYGHPTIMLDHVIIPPLTPSGIDNYEEDLPRGVSGLIDGQPYRSDLLGLDPSKLDGEWCVVGFVGGSIIRPYIMSWWPHPANVYDPATSGGKPPTADASGSASVPNLIQYDLKTNRGRKMWRKNGTLFLVNREGSVYLDTSEAGRKVSVDESSLLNTSQVPKGGHAQMDMKKTAQLEVNWNETFGGPQIGAGSSFKTTVCGEQVGSGPNCMFESDFPQDQPLPNTNPTVPPRQTTRTIIQGKEYEVIVKTSKLVLAAQAGGSAAGEVDLLVDALIKLKAGSQISMEAPKVDVTATNVKMLVTEELYALANEVELNGAYRAGLHSGVTAFCIGDVTSNLGVEGCANTNVAGQIVKIKGGTIIAESQTGAALSGGISAMLTGKTVFINGEKIYLGGATISDQHLPLGDNMVTAIEAVIDAIKALTVDTVTGMVTAPSQAVLEATKAAFTNALSTITYCK